VFAACSSSGKDAVRIGFDQLDVIRKFVDKYSDTFESVTTAQGTYLRLFILRCNHILAHLLKGHMSCCHHLASVVDRLNFLHLNLLL
jgi:hypothetical protein